MAAESPYLLVMIGFALQMIRGSKRTPGLTVLIRAFGRMTMSPIVGTEILSVKATFGVRRLSMSDLAIWHQSRITTVEKRVKTAFDIAFVTVLVAGTAILLLMAAAIARIISRAKTLELSACSMRLWAGIVVLPVSIVVLVLFGAHPGNDRVTRVGLLAIVFLCLSVVSIVTAPHVASVMTLGKRSETRSFWAPARVREESRPRRSHSEAHGLRLMRCLTQSPLLRPGSCMLSACRNSLEAAYSIRSHRVPAFHSALWNFRCGRKLCWNERRKLETSLPLNLGNPLEVRRERSSLQWP